MSLGWKQQFSAEFDISGELITDANGGGATFNVSGGEQEISLSASSARWDSVVQQPGIAYQALDGYRDASTGAFFAYTKLTSATFAGSGELYHQLVLWVDLDYAFATWYNLDTDAIETRFKLGSGSNFVGGTSAGGVGSPGDVWLKMYWNTGTETVLTQEGDSLVSDNVRSYYSLDGSNYTLIHSGTELATTPALIPDNFGVSLFTGGSQTTTASFDFLEFWEYTDLSTPPSTILITEAGQTNSAFDGYSFLSPYNGASSDVERISEDGYDGYNFTIQKTSDWEVGTLTVNVDVDGDAYYQPINRDPAPGEVEVSQSALITFRVNAK